MKTVSTFFLFVIVIFVSSCSEDPVVPNQSVIPSKPRNLTSTFQNYTVTLDWETPENTGSPIITKYLIYRKIDSLNYENIAFTNYNITTFIDSSILATSLTKYFVTAINPDGESEKSNEVSSNPIPSEPRNLTASFANNFVVLNWETPSNTGNPVITKYQIFRRVNGSIVSNIGFTNFDIRTYVDSSVNISNTNYYYVNAINANGQSENSNEVSISNSSKGTNLSVFNVNLDIGNVDVEINGIVVASNMSYTERLNYQQLTSGKNRIKIINTSGTTIIDTTSYLADNNYYSFYIYDSGGLVKPLIVTDNNTPHVNTIASVSFINFAEGTESVDMGADSKITPWFPFSNYAQAQNYRPINGGTYDLYLRDAGTPITIGTLNNQTIVANKIYSIIGKGIAGGIGSSALGLVVYLNQ